MNPNSFKLDNDLRSFRLDQHIAYYYHRFKEFLRNIGFELLGVGKSTISHLRTNISNKEYDDPFELFKSVVDFFNILTTGIEVCIYRHQTFDNSLVLYIGDSLKFSKRVFLNDVIGYDYINEKKALVSDGLSNYIRGDGDGAKAAININGFLLAFYVNSYSVGKKVRFISSIFTIGLADIIKAKLSSIENKYTDPRTGLYNSKFIRDMIDKGEYSIIKLDIDDFKMINDTYGHAAGDAVLEELGKLFKSATGLNDKACREGGDEFLILVDDKTEEVMEKIIVRINDGIYELNKYHNFIISVSIGYCVYEEKLSIQERLKIADEYMYSKKNMNSQIYRLAKKVTEIRDPKIYKSLLKHIIINTPKKDIDKIFKLSEEK